MDRISPVIITSEGWKVCLDSISATERCAARRQYRLLRLRIPYAEPGSPHLDGSRCHGMSYGQSRDEAKSSILNFYRELDWIEYLASK